jgi:hypothetical protein
MLVEAEKRLRRVRGHEAMPVLLSKLGVPGLDKQEVAA